MTKDQLVTEPSKKPAHLVHLAPLLDLSAASVLAAELQTCRGADLKVVASDVKRIGSQCIQVLLSAQATWLADDASFQVLEPSNDFVDTITLLNADCLLPGLDTPEPTP